MKSPRGKHYTLLEIVREPRLKHPLSCRVYAVQVADLLERMRKGTAKDCFAVHFLKETEKSDMDHDQKLFVLGSLLEAGSDTSRMTMSQILAAAILYPEWVQTARSELDRVCGEAQRLPGWQDRLQLDYITAAVKESFRWRPFAPIGVPHMLSVDDEYEGFKFPAGTLFTWNSLYISQNEHEQAHRFYPERFLNDKLHNVMEGHWAFGPGIPFRPLESSQMLTICQAGGFAWDTMLPRQTYGSL